MSTESNGKFKRTLALLAMLAAIGALIWGCNCSCQPATDGTAAIAEEPAAAPQAEAAAEPQPKEAETEAVPAETTQSPRSRSPKRRSLRRQPCPSRRATTAKSARG